MDCCRCQLIETQFDREVAESKVRGYHEKGPQKETRILVEALLLEGVDGSSMLDVGGGIGVLEFELIKAGAASAINVEASSAYVDAAREEASRQGLSAQIQHIHGDFVDLAPDVPPADIVTLDKVVCCYDDMQSLVRGSVAKATKLYGLIYPRDNWWVKVAIGIKNLYRRLRGNDFRVIVHPTKEVDRLVKEAGMKVLFHRELIDWQVVVYGR
jgi:2-polyprenyl-3-methyl-5-hydroxy-6-metoxy-1,4-benzoquinol methylase